MLAPSQDFPALNAGAGHFLDSAASSLKPMSVLQAMHEFASTVYANVHRGAYRLSTESTARYEQARVDTAVFLGAGRPEEVVLCRGTTTGLNMVASGWGANHLREGDLVLLTLMEHHANIVPWQMLATRVGASLDYVDLTADFELDLDDFYRKLDRRPRVVSFTGMSNVLGTIPPIATMAEAARRAGALVVVDGAQLVPHRPVDVSLLGADFLAFSAHKALGPTGIGALWGRMERLGGDGAVRGRGRDDFQCRARPLDLGGDPAPVRGWHSPNHRGGRSKRRPRVSEPDRHGPGREP